MSRDFNITVRHESGRLSTHVLLLPDSPNKKPIGGLDVLNDTEVENTFKVEKFSTVAEYLGLTIRLLAQDLLNHDAEGKAAK